MTKEIIIDLFTKYDLIVAFGGVVAFIVYISYGIAKIAGQKRMGSAIAIIFGLGLSYVGGGNNWRGG